MGIDRSGTFLEGIRFAGANSPFTFPARSIISSQTELDSVSERAEYILWASGQENGGIEIADPNLTFYWTKNDNSILRFDWNGFARRWDTKPGSGERSIGTIGNEPRLVASSYNPIASDSPYYVYIGSPARIVTFTIALVPDPDSFGSPSSGIVELSESNFELNFSLDDINNPALSGRQVFVSQQSFFDRTKSNGSIGTFPSSSSIDYDLFLNPIPGGSTLPRVRIGFREYLVSTAVEMEDQLYVPSSGCVFSRDTGKVIFSPADVDNFSLETIYYDGVYYGELSFSEQEVGITSSAWPSFVSTESSLVGATDGSRYVFYSYIGTDRYYFETILESSVPATEPDAGTVIVDSSTGRVYISSSDASTISGSLLYFIDCLLEIEDGVSVQFYRSGSNTSGIPDAPDYKEKYEIGRQIIVDGLQQSPFALLPVIPLEDSVSVSVEQGTTGGTFTGSLVDSRNPELDGLGYLLDLNSRQLKFTSRSSYSITIPRATSSVKLNNAPISPFGLEISINGESASPSTDFDLNSDSGQIEFTESIGSGSSGDKVGNSGSTVFPNIIQTTGQVFVEDDVGGYVLITSGSFVGFYQIDFMINGSSVGVSGVPFTQNESVVFDVRASREIICDRFWRIVEPEIQDFLLEKSSSISGPWGSLGREDYTVLATTGQVNLSSPSSPGDIFRITYTSQDSDDNGVTVTPTDRVDFVGFKIRQELCTYAPNTGNIKFNPDNKTVLPDLGFNIYVEGVTAENFQYIDINTISLGVPLTNQEVFIDYWIAESPGGVSVFNTRFSPVAFDLPSIVSGESSISLNGDWSSIQAGSGFLIEERDVLIVFSSDYDSTTNTTELVFTYPFPEDSDGTNILSCDPVTGSYLITESIAANSIGNGSNVLTILGLVTGYKPGTLVFLDDDAYLVLDSQQDQNFTHIYLTASVKRSYTLPAVRRTILPILFPGKTFETSKSAMSSREFVLVQNGSQDRVLIQGSDYDLSDGGIINLQEEIFYPDSLSCVYVARQNLDAGSEIEVNAANFISPDDSNGLLGQKLAWSYDLLNPDTFFYRIETFDSFLPELLDELGSGSGGSGPNVGDSSSLQNKDMGKPSLYFDEQHYDNLDEMSSRLVLFYNDLINGYEDILANLDGRVVGGDSGKFRYDGDRSGNARNSYSSVQNDIDDRIKLYDDIALVSLDPISFGEVPVYGFMWNYNSQSRLFPTSALTTVAINGNVATPDDFGKVLGTFPVGNLTGADNLISTRARAAFDSVQSNLVTINCKGTNGNTNGMVPAFIVGQSISILDNNGEDTDFTSTIVSINSSPFTITLADALETGSGVIVSDVSDLSDPNVHNYQIGRHVTVDFESGQIKNAQLPPPDGPTNVLIGNELLDSSITYSNTSTSLFEVPVLTGSTLNDDGYSSKPTLVYSNEVDLLKRETLAYNYFGTAIVSTIDGVVSSTISVLVGQQIYFFVGPNSGTIHTVLTVGPSAGTFTVSPSFSTIDLTSREMMVISPSGNIFNILAEEIDVIRDNEYSSPTAIIGTINSEIVSAESCAQSSSTLILGSSGSINAGPSLVTITDTSANFTDLIDDEKTYIIVVYSGVNRGVYGVASGSGNQLTISSIPPFVPFVSTGGTLYQLREMEGLSPESSSGFLSSFIRSGLDFASLTGAWASSISNAAVPFRLSDVNTRIDDINIFIQECISILNKPGKLYEGRLLWVSQRVDKKNGFLSKTQQAKTDRVDAEAKLIADQKKLLATQSL